jgi:hypothetical protein
MSLCVKLSRIWKKAKEEVNKVNNFYGLEVTCNKLPGNTVL